MRIKTVVIVVGAAIGIAVAGSVLNIVIKRAGLPDTACAVTRAQYDALPMTVSYDQARAAIGCDGALVMRENGVETYAWRGETWPYGRVEAMFINGKLEGKSSEWNTLFASARENERTDAAVAHDLAH